VFGPYAQPFGDRSSGGAQFGVNADYTYELLSVPEPGMITLLSLSGLALVVFRRRA